jgi:hypothetical protein
MGMVLDAAREVTGADSEPVCVDGAWLKEQGVEPEALNTWYVPDNEPEWRYAWDIDCAKARRDGLTVRPLQATIEDTLSWDATRTAGVPRRTNLDPAREQELLELWRERAR